MSLRVTKIHRGQISENIVEADMTLSHTLVPFSKITKISYGRMDTRTYGQWSCAVPDVIGASRNKPGSVEIKEGPKRDFWGFTC